MTHLPKDIIAFWYEAGPYRWYDATPEFDVEVTAKWLAAHEMAARGDYDGWKDGPEGALALLLLLDQFPRNMFRGTPRAFATDPLAYEVAAHALAQGFDQKFKNPWRRFFYLPFMHSENLADQKRCLELCLACGDQGGIGASRIHLMLIARFGRFPHRNGVLGREMTPGEQAYLHAGGWSG
ncbi:DUF924 family protein [Methyloferula stellata]|uniref:DUF924 family protein n=1 Tax=Methyloferula stellata TaxID=876270 RepID=UPI000372DD44|nr:DUF924 family protein [Methyloferula stellata]